MDEQLINDHPLDALEGRLVTATITSATADVAIASLHNGAIGLLPVTEVPPGHTFMVGQKIQALAFSHAGRTLLSAVHPSLVTAVLMGVSPEVRAGSVRIMGVARRPGLRTKVAVAATEAGVDAVASCIGRRQNRIEYLKQALLGERVDVVAWHADQETFLRNALQPAGVGEIAIENGKAVVQAPTHRMSAAVGNGGLNSALAGELVGLHVAIVATPGQ